MEIKDINNEITKLDYKGGVSDGHHTFDDVYHHRTVLFSVILRAFPDRAWKSLKHADGTMYENYFIAGIDTPQGQYSYHHPLDEWCYFDDIQELPNAPEWDDNQPDDVVRLLSLLKHTE